jgi:hypothetical protein
MLANVNQIERLLHKSRDRTRKTGEHHVSLSVTFKDSKYDAELLKRLFTNAEDKNPTIPQMMEKA